MRQPLSRSYFKMIELWKKLDLTKELATLVKRDGGLLTAHAAEGPGGFIEACTVTAGTWKFKSATAITLRSEAKNVPGWRKAQKFLSSNPHVYIHDGADGTGNILLKENQTAFIEDIRKENPLGVHLFTADGGFDFSSDFNAQEDSVLPLLLAEVLLGLQVLTKGGVLIIKCFDTTEQSTLDLLWLISRAFCEWGIVKPNTSRAGNAERYIIGKGFLGEIDDIIDILQKYQQIGKFDRPILAPVESACYKKMMVELEEIQARIEHIEIAVIRDTLDLIRSNDTSLIRRLVRENVERSLDWCGKHAEPIAPLWKSDLDNNVTRECADLLHILNPSQNTVSYGYGHSFRSTTSSNVSFVGFRSGSLPSTNSATNPFNRGGK